MTERLAVFYQTQRLQTKLAVRKCFVIAIENQLKYHATSALLFTHSIAFLIPIQTDKSVNISMILP